MPRITVLIPTHMEAAFLATTIRSVLGQGDLEVLVAGDGCTDESAKVVAGINDPRVRWLDFPKAPGFGYATRNRALTCASGDLIAYLAPDDLWGPRHLQMLVQQLDEQRLDMVFARPVLGRPDGSFQPHYFPFDLAGRWGASVVRPRLFFVSPSRTLHRRDVLERVGGWNANLQKFGDIDLWLRFQSTGARIGFNPRATVLRLPALYFRRFPELHRSLHDLWGQRLISGELDLERITLTRRARALAWLSDFAEVALAKGVPFCRALWIRSRQSSTGIRF
jgi:GT2 family glycosyltransferase